MWGSMVICKVLDKKLNVIIIIIMVIFGVNIILGCVNIIFLVLLSIMFYFVVGVLIFNFKNEKLDICKIIEYIELLEIIVIFVNVNGIICLWIIFILFILIVLVNLIWLEVVYCIIFVCIIW